MKAKEGDKAGEAGSSGIGDSGWEPACVSSGVTGCVLSAWDSAGTCGSQGDCYCALLQMGTSRLGRVSWPGICPFPHLPPRGQQEEALTLRPLWQGPQTPVQ